MINGESLTTQHRLVVVDCELKSVRRGRQEVTPRIKWWKLREEESKTRFKEEVMREITPKESVNEWWKDNSSMIVRIGEEVLGKTSGKGPPGDKETWWWNEEVQEKVKMKKEAKKIFERTGSEEDRQMYRRANKEAKGAVAKAKAGAVQGLYEELETPEGSKRIYKIAKSRDKLINKRLYTNQTGQE